LGGTAANPEVTGMARHWKMPLPMTLDWAPAVFGISFSCPSLRLTWCLDFLPRSSTAGFPITNHTQGLHQLSGRDASYMVLWKKSNSGNGSTQYDLNSIICTLSARALALLADQFGNRGARPNFADEG